jgi:hypothetical protein
LAVLSRRDGRGSANFRDLYASRLISVAADCSKLRGTKALPLKLDEDGTAKGYSIRSEAKEKALISYSARDLINPVTLHPF